MSRVTEFLTSELAARCAKEIVSAFAEQGNAESIEVDFHINKGKMTEPLEQANTWFKFDPNKGFLKETIDFLTELWREDGITEAEAKTASEEIRNFEKLVQDTLNREESLDIVANVLRERVFKGVPEAILPIKKMIFHRIEFSGEDEQGYILKVQKFAAVDRSTGEFINQPEAVAPELIQIHSETGRPFKEIIEEKRLEGDARYKYVEDAHLERYTRHISIAMSADYSFCEKPVHEQTA